MTDKSMYKDMWVFIEHDGREVSPVSLELLCEVRKLCDRSGDRLAAVLAGELPEPELAKIRGCGTDLIIAVEGEGYFPPSVDAYTALFTRLCTERRPSAVFVGGTIFGRDFAPRFACRLGTGCTSDATELVYDEKTGCIEFVEPAVGGRLMAVITVPEARPQVGTIRPGTFKYAPAGERECVTKRERIDFPASEQSTRILSFEPDAADESLNIAAADVIVCVGNGINIHRMHTPARKRESLLLKYMYLYNRDFATEENKQWYDLSDSYSIEGGDVLVLSKDIVAVGLSQRTTVSGAETFARNLLQNSGFKKVLAFDIPETRAFMHLDTVFTMVDYDKFTIHPEIEGPLSVYEMMLDEHGELKFAALKDELKDILALELKLPAVDLIRCGGGDLMAAQREQWNDGSNTLCIAPGRVITYERNYVTNDLLAKHGLDVLTVPSAELSRGRGGPRCMSCPVNRDDL